MTLKVAPRLRRPGHSAKKASQQLRAKTQASSGPMSTTCVGDMAPELACVFARSCCDDFFAE